MPKITTKQDFNVEYYFYIVYEINNINLDTLDLKLENRFEFELHRTINENKDVIPLQIPFCTYRRFNFKQIKFGDTIKI